MATFYAELPAMCWLYFFIQGGACSADDAAHAVVNMRRVLLQSLSRTSITS